MDKKTLDRANELNTNIREISGYLRDLQRDLSDSFNARFYHDAPLLQTLSQWIPLEDLLVKKKEEYEALLKAL